MEPHRTRDRRADAQGEIDAVEARDAAPQDRLAELRAPGRFEAGIAAAHRSRITPATGTRPPLGTATLARRTRPVPAIGTTPIGRATALARAATLATFCTATLGSAALGSATLRSAAAPSRATLFGRAAPLGGTAALRTTRRRAAPATFTTAHAGTAARATRTRSARAARAGAAACATARTTTAARTGSRSSAAACSTGPARTATGSTLGEGRRRARHDDRCGHRRAENPVHVPSHYPRRCARWTLDPGRNGDGIETVPTLPNGELVTRGHVSHTRT